jgi:hypothetical protein
VFQFARKPTFGFLQRIDFRNFHGEFMIAFRTIEILQLKAVTTGRCPLSDDILTFKERIKERRINPERSPASVLLPPLVR